MKKISVMGRNYTLDQTLAEMNSSWGVKHLCKVKNNFCENICKGKSCKMCEKCEIEQCFNLSLKEIKEGKRKELIPCAECFSDRVNYGARRYYNGKGVKTEVWYV